MTGHRWRLARRIVQAVVFAAFAALVIATAANAPALTGALVRLDPLAGLAASLSSRRIFAAFWPALGMLALALAVGRAWCGWLCPLGSLIDWTAPRKGHGRALPERWRGAKYGLLLLILGGALVGSLTLLAFDPLTQFVRALAVAVLPAFQWLVSRLQEGLYRTGALAGLADGLDGLLRPALLSYAQPHAQGVWAVAALLGGVLLLNRLAPRAWCRYLCPLGALLGLASKGAALRRQVGPACVSCGACAHGCPMGAVSAAQGYASDSGECTACMECVADCPQSAIRWAPGRRYAWNRAYDPSRRHALGMVGLGLAGAALASVTPEAHHPNATLLRPPGAREADLLSACARCGACMRACPTHGLQPATTEAGLAGFWTPVLVPRLGQCDYACNACGQACPTGAVPLLSLEEKRLTPIGKAFVDRNLCLAWSGRAPCIVCEEMCPLPDKAIVLEAVEAVDPWGNAVTYQAPVVRHERCIGCGICEYRCPVVGEAAIRVRVDPLA